MTWVILLLLGRYTKLDSNFKERVRNALISRALAYKENYVNY